ncbi:MAG: bifunctional proline dehydrogenase/L-glutamate gamma-semialdehyde dehydrogenase PutA [Pseudomonadota bacterium]
MDLQAYRARIRNDHRADEEEFVKALLEHAPRKALRQAAEHKAALWVTALREAGDTGMMDSFLAEYGLSTREGVALMCLAEALLRVPDAKTMDALIEDKIAPSDWGKHLGHSSSSLVNASTWALMLTGKVLQDGEGMAGVLTGAVRRMGEPVIRSAVTRAMREMGRQFVLGETIDKAFENGAEKASKGYSFSFDMLGEAAMTQADADAYMQAYGDAIARLAKRAHGSDPRENPGISIKLSALHPRYEEAQRDRVMTELVPRVLELTQAAARAGLGLNIDAEEADRLEISLDVIQAVLSDPSLVGWTGFGVVVQAYSKRALGVIDWLYALAEALDRRIMVRLVKGAYWDSEIKHAQTEGLSGFPVFTRKSATDVSYGVCAARLMSLTDRIYPQFATHNAHTMALVLELAGGRGDFEFQRLHGMGEALHDAVKGETGVRDRIYAPVGAHRDLLAYLVRRLLENGANSSFVNQIVDADVPVSDVVADPFEDLLPWVPVEAVVPPAHIFGVRANARGFDLSDPVSLAAIEAARAPWAEAIWKAGAEWSGDWRDVRAPSDGSLVGRVRFASAKEAEAARDKVADWTADTTTRARVLRRAADVYEENYGELFALLAREAGKSMIDAVAELREAVDFLRYYADQAESLSGPARGKVAAISPWNFPLAIFTGQIAAALAVGNGVVAKPAESTGLVASRAVDFLHQAGVPLASLRLVHGAGHIVGSVLSAKVDAMCFTGSTQTAQAINRAMAQNAAPTAPMIAETGGLNAMIVDSTALPEQAVRDVVASAFQSAGQRCSAARILYVQEDVAETFATMLMGAMDELHLGDPWHLKTDVGPVIDASAKSKIERHIASAEKDGRLLKRLDAPQTGTFVGPALISVSGIDALKEEIFGPVLHLATFKVSELSQVTQAINNAGYGLTFGIQSRIDDRVETVTRAIKAGNLYVNRNQIGAVVGSQPFGGSGLSGTGPKAGGPRYLKRFLKPLREILPEQSTIPSNRNVQAEIEHAQAQGMREIGRAELPGPTGESNLWSLEGRGVILALGPTEAVARRQAAAIEGAGARAVMAPDLSVDAVAHLSGMAGVVCFAPDVDLCKLRQALAARDGALVPLFAEADFATWCSQERHMCIDTTASGGNAALLAAVG